jgi:hypothetical protein
VLVQVGDQHVGAFAREGEGDGAADAAVAAGDDGRLVLEAAVADIARLAVVGPGRQLRFMAGRGLLLRGLVLLHRDLLIERGRHE